MSDRDRLDRAHSYVRGLMDPAERERAERDMEVDAEFRDAVTEVAERMRTAGAKPGDRAAENAWQMIAARLSMLPHMKSGPQEQSKPFGRRRTDRPGRPPPVPTVAPMEPQTTDLAPQSVPGWRAAVIVSALIAAFALGYIAGANSILAPAQQASQP